MKIWWQQDFLRDFEGKRADTLRFFSLILFYAVLSFVLIYVELFESLYNLGVGPVVRCVLVCYVLLVAIRFSHLGICCDILRTYPIIN